MTVQDDYPAITILADAVAGKADDSVPEAVRAWREVARLRQWKEEAMVVLAEWDKVHYEVAGASAHIGRSKAENVRRELLRLRGQCEVWMNGVADIVEPWGYDRRAASGPADLLPGLTSITERLRECVEARRYLYEQVVEITAKPPAPGLRDGIRERPSTWPPDSGDTVENRNLPAAPPEVGDDPADRRPCTCGHPQAEGVIHRPGGPCFHVSEVAATPSDQVT